MDKISYQNGFICGLATRGLTRSGHIYEPVIYNDTGVYSFFYIDFRRGLEPFSIGMLNESIIVTAGTQLAVTGVEQAWTQNPYSPVSEDVLLSGGTKTDIVCSLDVLSLGAE
ncbi:MAG: hypothetical protein RR394_06915 [Oscillospiraceae bacterium]